METKRYGSLPIDLGEVPLANDESMLYLYMPVKLKGQKSYSLPTNTGRFGYLLHKVYGDLGHDRWLCSYIYLTVKAMYVSGDNTGQRPGWHSDGFMTDDLNYIWYDPYPTLFYAGQPITLPQDHEKSLEELYHWCDMCDSI